MSEYIIQEETLTDIADAIRSKTGESNIINTMEMAEKIRSISGGSELIELTKSEYDSLEAQGLIEEGQVYYIKDYTEGGSGKDVTPYLDSIEIQANAAQTISVSNASASSIPTQVTSFKQNINTNSDVFEFINNSKIKIKKDGVYLVDGQFSYYISGSTKRFVQFAIRRIREGSSDYDVIGNSKDDVSTCFLSGQRILSLKNGDVLAMYAGGGYGTFTYSLNYNATTLPVMISCILLKAV